MLLFGVAAPLEASAEPRDDARIDLVTGLRPFRDLQRYFAGGRAGRAAALAARGRWRMALRELGRALQRREVRESLRGPAAYLAGLAAHTLGEFARAAHHLAEALEAYPEMRNEIRYLLGDSLLRAGEAGRAVAILAEVPPDSQHFEAARLSWARALARSAAPEEVAFALMKFMAAHPLDEKGLPALPPVGRPPTRQTGAPPPPSEADTPGTGTLARRAEVALLLGRALEQSRQLTSAVSQYLYVWARFPGTSFAGRASERLRALRRMVGRSVTPDLYHRFVRARAFLAMRQPRQARQALTPLLQEVRRGSSSDLRWPIELALGIALARSGETQAAVHRFRAIAQTTTDPEIGAAALFRAAEVLARRRQVARAIEFYRESAERFPESRVAAQALFDGAELAWLYRQDAKARSLYEKLLASYPASEPVPRARWRLGWYAFRRGDFPVAAEHFRAVVEGRSRGNEERRALYWYGRAEEERGRLAHALAAYRLLTRVYPLTFYAYQARGRLAELAAHEASDIEAALAPSVGGPVKHARSEFTDERLLRVRELVRLGLHREAMLSLKKFERGKRTTPGGLMAVAALYQEMGATRRAHWVLRLRASAFRADPDRRELIGFWKLAYFLRHHREIENAAQRAGIPPALLLALVREESTFEPRAVSPQQAIGLTQVIWETAQDMARALGIRLRSRSDLFSPKLNALLGARFLATLIRYYRGRPILAMAAYNAGPGNVDRWLGSRGLRRDGPVPVDEFVEEIPFEETRRYVKKVFGSYAAYGHLYYGERVAALPIPLGMASVDP
jgi:soluble lytic murein transglycosylase